MLREYQGKKIESARRRPPTVAMISPLARRAKSIDPSLSAGLEVVDAIVSSLGDGVLWDIGANFGLHGLTAKFLRPDCANRKARSSRSQL